MAAFWRYGMRRRMSARDTAGIELLCLWRASRVRWRSCSHGWMAFVACGIGRKRHRCGIPDIAACPQSPSDGAQANRDRESLAAQFLGAHGIVSTFLMRASRHGIPNTHPLAQDHALGMAALALVA